MKQVNDQLNQAIELLKVTRERITAMQDPYESMNVRHNMGNYARHEIDKFLTSLEEEQING